MVCSLVPGMQPDHTVVDVSSCSITSLILHPVEHSNTVLISPCPRDFLSILKTSTFPMLSVKAQHSPHKVCGLYVVTSSDRMPTFAWYMARFIVKNGHHKDMCYDEIGLCAQNIDTFLGSIINTIGDHIERRRTFNLMSYNFCISTLILKLKMTTFVREGESSI